MLTLTTKTPLWMLTAVLPFCLSVITQADGRNNSDCSAGGLPTVFGTPAQPLDGQVLNLEDRAICNGTVTAWRACYYVNGTETTEIDVGIWRENSGSGMFEIVNNCTLPVPSVVNPSFEFVCQQWDLDLLPEECYDWSVHVDDVIGVQLTKEMTLNVLERVEGSTLLLRENVSSDDAISTTLTDSGLYIEAKIGTDETVHIALESTATPDPTPSTATPDPIQSTATPDPIQSTATLDPIQSTATLDPTGNAATSDPTPRSTATPDPTGSTATPDPTLSTATPDPTLSTATPDPTTQRTGIPQWAVHVITILGAVIVMLVVLILLCALYGHRYQRKHNKNELSSTTPGAVRFQLEDTRVDMTTGHNSTVQPQDVQIAMHNVGMTETPTFVDIHGMETSAFYHQQTVSRGPTPQASSLSVQPTAKSHPTLPVKSSPAVGHGRLEDSLSSPSNRAKALTPFSPEKPRMLGHHRAVRRSSSDGVLLSPQPCVGRALHTTAGIESPPEIQSDEHMYASITSIPRRSVSESHLVDLPFENLPSDLLLSQDEVSYTTPRSPHPYLQYTPVYSYAYARLKLTYPRPDNKLYKQSKLNSSLPSVNENALVNSQQSDNTYENVEPSNMALTGWFTSPRIPGEESSAIGTRRKSKLFLNRNPVQNLENQPAYHCDYAIVGNRVRFYSLPGTFPGKHFRPTIKPIISPERWRKEALQQRKPTASEESAAQNGFTDSEAVAYGSGYTDLRYSRMDPAWQATYQSTSRHPSSDCTDLSLLSPRTESDYDYYVNDDQYLSGTSPYSRRYMRLQETRQTSIDSYQLPDDGQCLRRLSKANQSRMYNDVGLQGLPEEVTELLHAPLLSTSDNTSKAESDVEYDHLNKSSEYDSLVGLSIPKV